MHALTEWHLCTLSASYFWRVGSARLLPMMRYWLVEKCQCWITAWSCEGIGENGSQFSRWPLGGGGCERFVVQGDGRGAGPQRVSPKLLKSHDKLLSKEQMLFTEPFSSRPQLMWPMIGLWFLPALLLNVHLPGEGKTGQSWEQTRNGHTSCRRNRNRGNERELLLSSTYVSKMPTGT